VKKAVQIVARHPEVRCKLNLDVIMAPLCCCRKCGLEAILPFRCSGLSTPPASAFLSFLSEKHTMLPRWGGVPMQPQTDVVQTTFSRCLGPILVSRFRNHLPLGGTPSRAKPLI
jgi:hypothetical protein